MNRIEEIRAREQAATLGPWYADGWALWNDAIDEFIELHDTEADAQFIAHARQDIPYLLSEIDRLTAELEQYRKQEAEITEENKALKCELDNSQPCFACINFRRNGGECHGAGCCRYDEEAAQKYQWGWRGKEIMLKVSIAETLIMLSRNPNEHPESYQ